MRRVATIACASCGEELRLDRGWDPEEGSTDDWEINHWASGSVFCSDESESSPLSGERDGKQEQV